MGLFRVIISGATPAPGEVWSCGLNWQGTNAELTHAQLQAWATGIGTAITATSGNGLIALLSSAGTIREIRTEQRDEANENLMQAAEYQFPTPKTGAGTPNKTLQASMCVSLLTGQPGRSHRGRIYWPAWSYTNLPELLFGPATINGALTGFNDLVDLIIAQGIVVDPGMNFDLVVRSRLLHESFQVLTVAAGNVPDSQRRRRDNLQEVYVVQPISP